MSLLDSWMPSFDLSARYATQIHAPPERVYAALLATDFSRPLLVRALMGLRLVPAFLLSPRKAWSRFHRGMRGTRASLQSLATSDFQMLAEAPPRELVLGITGRFWTLQATMVRLPQGEFRDPLAPGLAQAVWNFEVLPALQGSTLSTETRIRCADPATLRTFTRYWRVVAPGSGLIRHAILSQVRREALASVS
jgi:hypothetical protein